MSELVSIRGEYISTDWQVGLFSEKDRVEKEQGRKGNICSILSFDYKGSIESLRTYSISERMEYLKGRNSAVGEIVKMKKPAGYVRFYTKLIEVKDSDVVNKGQMRLATLSARGRYCVLELRNDNPVQYRFLRGYYELEDAKKEIFGILRSNHTILTPHIFSYHYIYDTQTGKAYRCQPEGEQLKSTTRQSDDLNIITPLYRYIYYGYANS